MIKPQTVKHNHVVKSYDQPLILVAIYDYHIQWLLVPIYQKDIITKNFESSELQVTELTQFFG